MRSLKKIPWLIVCLWLAGPLGCADFAAIFREKGSTSHRRFAGGREYVVEKGDTLSEIAYRFGVSFQDLAELNNIHDPAALQVGQKIYIPEGRGKVIRKGDKRLVSSTGGASPKSSASSERVNMDHSRFIWPVEGKVTGPFGVRGSGRHDGIDISVPQGTPVKAAGSGKVVYAGSLGGYGNLIVVKHKTHFFTAYGHTKKYFVKKGDRVRQGQTIAEVGQTGRVTGPHLHFEVREKLTPRNPLFFLPR